MNNEENKLNNDISDNDINPPLEEVTVETSVPEEPYPVTDISSSVEEIMKDDAQVNVSDQVTVSEVPETPEPLMPSEPEPTVSETPSEVKTIASDVPPMMGEEKPVEEVAAPEPLMPSEPEPTVSEAPSAVEPTAGAMASSMMDAPSPLESSATPAPEMTPSPSEPQGGATGFEDVNKKSKVGLIIAIVLVILLGVGGYFAWTMFFSKSPYENAITSAFKVLKNQNLDKPFRVTTSVKVESKAEEAKFLSNYSFDYSVAMDPKANTSIMKFNVNEKGTSIIDALAYLKDSKAYIQSKKLTDKTYYIDEIDFGEMTNTEDITYLIGTFENVLKAALKDEKETKKDITLSIAGKSINATENIYKIDKNNIDRICKNSIDELLKDEKAIEILAKMSDAKASDIKKELEDGKKEKLGDTYTGESSISIYTKGFFKTFAGFSMASGNTEYIKYIIDGDDESLVININEKDKITMEGSKDTADIKIIMDGETIATGKVTNKDNTTTIVIDIPEYVKVTIDVKMEENIKIDSVDVANAIKIDDMSEADMESIETKLEEILEKTELYSELGSLLGDTTSDLEYSYPEYSGSDYLDFNTDGIEG